MALIRSRRGGHARAAPFDWALAGLVAWIGPSLLGLALMALGAGLSRGAGWPAVGALPAGLPGAAMLLGGTLFLSPLYSWAGLLPAVPAVWLLLRHGLGGWVSFLVLGLVLGDSAGRLVLGSADLARPVGALSALLFRATFFRLDPDIFTTR